jgi:sterol desaturase/sphingolipid hydroxylase (fatty acid hydroxylase superfamily)
MITVAFVLAGWFAWTLGEYVLHRFAMHSLRGKGLPSREHLIHHSEADSVLEKWWMSWTGIVIVGVVLGLAVNPAFGFGWIAGYGFYDLQHYRAHRRAPRTRYQRWLRRHHFHHHFGHPLVNHGVTWSLWDRAFGTWRAPGTIKVPRRLAMVWLVDDHGALRPAFAGDYELVGSATRDERQQKIDRARAFANLAPTTA